MGTLTWAIIIILVCLLVVKKWDFIEELIKDLGSLIGIAVLVATCYFAIKGTHWVLSHLMGDGVLTWIVSVVVLFTVCICFFKHNG